jgi:hypothetical protein
VQSKGVITGIVIIACIGLAGADYVFKERHRPTTMPDGVAIDVVVPQTNTGYTLSQTTGSSTTVTMNTQSSASTSSVAFVKKGTSMKKKSSVSVDDVIQKLGLVSVQTSERSLLSISVTTVPVHTSVLLLRGDRALLFSWIESDDVKDIMTTMKKSLQDQFSVQVSGLLDETRQTPNGPPMDVLRFLDPAISSEEIYILRVRNRLYEIHVAKNGTDVLAQLMEELGK